MTDTESMAAPAGPVRKLRDDRGQGLVEYALILALVSLAAIVALGFLSGKINSLFSKTGNSLNNVNVAGAGPSSPPPPPPGTVIGTGPLGQNLYYIGPGLANGSGSLPDGVEGVYALVTISSPTSFNVNGWTFTCAWHTPLTGIWTYDINGNGSISASETFASMCNAPAAPSNQTLPTVTGTPARGQTLTAVNGTWTNSPTGFTYQWQISGATANCGSASGWQIIFNPNGGNQTFTIPSSGNVNTILGFGGVNPVGRCIRVQVQASNASGSFSGGTSAASPSAAVGPVTS